MALRNSTVDVFLASFNQVAGDRSGVVGRIKSIKNGVVTHYDPGAGRPRRAVVQQRSGFATLTTSAHDSETGAPTTPNWTNPELLSTIGSELLSIANAIPRVYDGTDWTYYAAERCVSNILSEEVFHTSQRTIQAPDSAWKDGVTCSVWVETIGVEEPTTLVYVGFKGDDGAWVRTPQLVYDPGVGIDDYASMARVVADKVDDYFWVILNTAQGIDNEPVFRVVLFSLNGQQIDVDLSVGQIWDEFPGYWDVYALDDGGVELIQPLHTAGEAADGVSFHYYTQTAGAIDVDSFTNTALHCRGPLAFMTNDTEDGLRYIATIGVGTFAGGRLWAYRNTGSGTFDHEFNFNTSLPDNTISDSLIGYVLTTASNQQSVTISVSILQTQAQTSGPAFDPQLRYSRSYTCTFADAVVLNRQNDYTCQVSRAFLHDGQYYSTNYYQSGSGNVLTNTQITVDFTAGDYMVGPLVQPIMVVPGDGTRGSPIQINAAFNGNGYNIVPSAAQGSGGILNTDTVEVINTPTAPVVTFTGLTTSMLKWTLANQASTNPNIIGGRLVVAGSGGVVGADGSWNIINVDATSIYTSTVNGNGGTTAGGTFTAGGTTVVQSVTTYYIDLNDVYDSNTIELLPNTTMTVSGAGAPNDGAKTILEIFKYTVSNGAITFSGVRVITASEVLQGTTYLATFTSGSDNTWSFSNGTFSSVLEDVPHSILVSESGFEVSRPNAPGIAPGTIPYPNDGEFPIVDVVSSSVVEVDATALWPHYYSSPLPTASVTHGTDITEYTFFLADLDVDYTLLNATLIVSGDTFAPENNGAYTIIDIDPDPSHHIVYCAPTDGRTDYRSQSFFADQQTITIIYQTNVNAEFQPAWLMVPLTGTKPVVGRWEYGIAYADWRFEGREGAPANLYPLHVSSPVRSDEAWLTVLPYRAISFTVGNTVVTASGQVVNAAISSNASTVGIKQFALEDVPGTASVASGEMLLPGPMCGEFTASGFHENGINFGFEAPWVVSQQESDNGIGLRKGGKYIITVVAEVTDEDGDRVFSIPSPPLNFQLTGDNDSVTYGGRMIQPLDSDGFATSNSYGVTNYRLVGISIYRTAYQDNVLTTERHKITLDLNVNGRAPVSSANASGFTLSEFTWEYLDENLDAAILPAEVCYTDKGFLPRFAAPAQRGGAFWKNRSWVIGYDGAIWMSGEKKEGDATWFFPLFRYVLPTTDKPVSIAEMDDYLEIQCEKSLWYIPGATFPDATGRGGTLPAPIQLPFTNGGTGHAITLRAGVAYSSTAGGVWMVTRAHENKWLSQPIQDALNTQTITSMTVDKRQRLHVTTGTGFIYVYDQVVEEWYRWTLPTSDAHFLSTLNGEAVFQQQTPYVWQATPQDYFDSLTGSPVGIALDIELYSLQFGNTRNLKAVWELQLIGEYKGPHNLNAVLSYPDDDPDNPTVFPDPADGPYTPDPDAAYLLAINPMIEQASSYGLRVFADFVGVDAQDIGNTFELELVSVEVGVDSGSGLDKMRDSRRLVGS